MRCLLGEKVQNCNLLEALHNRRARVGLMRQDPGELQKGVKIKGQVITNHARGARKKRVPVDWECSALPVEPTRELKLVPY